MYTSPKKKSPMEVSQPYCFDADLVHRKQPKIAEKSLYRKHLSASNTKGNNGSKWEREENTCVFIMRGNICARKVTIYRSMPAP